MNRERKTEHGKRSMENGERRMENGKYSRLLAVQSPITNRQSTVPVTECFSRSRSPICFLSFNFCGFWKNVSRCGCRKITHRPVCRSFYLHIIAAIGCSINTSTGSVHRNQQLPIDNRQFSIRRHFDTFRHAICTRDTKGQRSVSKHSVSGECYRLFNHQSPITNHQS
jgi:hypothetical protein